MKIFKDFTGTKTNHKATIFKNDFVEVIKHDYIHKHIKVTIKGIKRPAFFHLKQEPAVEGMIKELLAMDEVDLRCHIAELSEIEKEKEQKEKEKERREKEERESREKERREKEEQERDEQEREERAREEREIKNKREREIAIEEQREKDRDIWREYGRQNGCQSPDLENLGVLATTLAVDEMGVYIPEAEYYHIFENGRLFYTNKKYENEVSVIVSNEDDTEAMLVTFYLYEQAPCFPPEGYFVFEKEGGGYIGALIEKPWSKWVRENDPNLKNEWIPSKKAKADKSPVAPNGHYTLVETYRLEVGENELVVISPAWVHGQGEDVLVTIPQGVYEKTYTLSCNTNVYQGGHEDGGWYATGSSNW